jgi:hypothetical protein
VIKFVSDLRQFGGFLRVIRFFSKRPHKKAKDKTTKTNKNKTAIQKKAKNKKSNTYKMYV